MIMKGQSGNDLKTTLGYRHVTSKDLVYVVSPLEDIKDFLPR